MSRSFQRAERILNTIVVLLILFRPVPNLNVAVAASGNDAILFEPYPTHGICVHDFGLERSW